MMRLVFFVGVAILADVVARALATTQACTSTPASGTDAYGFGCHSLSLYPSYCGSYDDEDFSSSECCACGESQACTDRTPGTDENGSSCPGYSWYPSTYVCGSLDDEDFSSSECCACAPVSLPQGQMWEVVGPCTKVEKDGQECIQSPNYPSRYGNSQSCTIRIDESQAQEIWIDFFKTERDYDFLTINGDQLSGTRAGRHYPTESMIPQDPIFWASDISGKKKGWVICRHTREPCAGTQASFDTWCSNRCDDASNCRNACPRKCNSNCACTASRRMQELGIAMKSSAELQDEEVTPVVLV